MMTIKFREIKTSDAQQIAKIHCEELGDGILSLFGHEFIKRIYINLLEIGNWGFLAKDENDIIGFIFATKNEVPLYKCLTFSSIRFFVFESIRRPTKFFSFLIAFRESFLKSNKSKIKSTKTIIELSHLAVRGCRKGSGIGGSLIKMLEKKAKEEGYLNVFTKTHNRRLSNFYIHTKNASKIDTIFFGKYESMILKWKI